MNNLTYCPKTQTALELHSLRELPRNLIPGRGSRRNQSGARPKPVNRTTRRPLVDQQTKCRLVTALINHHTGTPFGAGVSPELDGLLPSERALLVVGISGSQRPGLNTKRVAVYGYRNGQSLLRFVLDFDNLTGMPKIRGTKEPRAAEAAAINWITGPLFGEFQAGIYDFSPRVVDEGMPLRQEFAAERTLHSNLDMFSRFLNRQADISDPALPSITPLLTAAQLPKECSPASLPVKEFQMTPSSYLAHAVDRFVLGLSRTDQEGFTGLKRAYIKQFEIADELRRTSDSEVGQANLIRVCAEQTGVGSESFRDGERGILKNVVDYIKALDLTPEAGARSVPVAYQSVKMLETYFLNRAENGSVIMYAPQDGTEEANALFNRPSTYTVTGAPLIITDGFMSDCRFPYDAKDLLS